MLNLKFQNTWDSQQGRDRKTSILVLVFWNFKVKVLEYQWNVRPHWHAIMILKFGDTPDIGIQWIHNISSMIIHTYLNNIQQVNEGQHEKRMEWWFWSASGHNSSSQKSRFSTGRPAYSSVRVRRLRPFCNLFCQGHLKKWMKRFNQSHFMKLHHKGLRDSTWIWRKNKILCIGEGGLAQEKKVLSIFSNAWKNYSIFVIL